jgi:hypothetical protein
LLFQDSNTQGSRWFHASKESDYIHRKENSGGPHITYHL